MLDNFRIVIAGGGTGGHLFPAIAIGEEIKERFPKAEIHFIGSNFGLEAKVYPVKDLLHTLLPIRGLQRGFSLASIMKNLILPYRILRSLLKVSALFKEFNPTLIIGTGGYASALPLFMATIQKRSIPIVLQEQNSFPGITTRWFSKKANLICAAFKTDNLNFDNKLVLTGNPIRNNIVSGNKTIAIKAYGMDIKKNTLFVFGGSQGSAVLNKSMESIINKFDNESIQVLWQTGDNDYSKYKKYKNNTIKIVPFINDMASAYALSNLVVCRSGALTLSEVTTCGKPSILIPFAAAAGNHQMKNAETLYQAGASILIEEKDLNSNELFKKINHLINNKKTLERMSIAAKALGKPNATKKIADHIIDMVSNV
ncbi:MAG: undecaprenyldiphospho-muramoylpentapeptide beta-N-acetylglucosaminyltransferase [Pelagibacteraceae bacterium]|nr:undecaprenyldiphospho-muramoylpentapeptide beta-N-acetylglucosaminyltransferase [Pelagibacteraceae bacterium]